MNGTVSLSRENREWLRRLNALNVTAAQIRDRLYQQIEGNDEAVRLGRARLDAGRSPLPGGDAEHGL